MILYLKDRRKYYKNGGLIRRMKDASGGPIHYSRTMTTDNLSKTANYVGEYILKGLGVLGKIMTAPLTGGPLGPATVILPKTKKLLDAERKLRETQELLIGRVSTWLSPLNYGAALATGNGLNARKGEKEVASWSPAWQAVGRLGEFYAGPKAIKGVKATPKVVVNTAVKTGVKPAKAAVVAREIKLGIKLNTKNGRIEVSDNYFNAPDKWYRITETPEKYGIMELGKNVTTHDAPKTLGTINGWRSSVLNAKVTKGSEGFIKKPSKIELNIRRKNGQAHGNTSLAAKGKLWGGTTSGSRLFPEGVIEGQAPSLINYGIDRTNFVVTPWEEVPNGGRVGFHTGEMPMSNLGWFQKTNKGTYTYEPIVPEKRITYQPMVLLEPLTSLKFFERKPSKINKAERAGNTKWERNFRPKYHVANYPGYQLKGLIKGSLLEKQLSKNGTININQLNAYFNKASQIEKDVANKVLSEKFAGLKTIDYNLFKKAILEELIGSYNRIPHRLYEEYGITKLGYEPVEIEKYSKEFKKHAEDRAYKLIRYANNHYLGNDPIKYKRIGKVVDNYRNMAYAKDFLRTKDGRIDYGVNLNTFTFESPRIPLGNNKHYDATTLGHSRTYTLPNEPNILHVMESLSDWAQSFKHLHGVESINDAPPHPLFGDINSTTYVSPLHQYLANNYLQRQLQENLKYAAENGLTKMRYPTSETAAKIEGYSKQSPNHIDENIIEQFWKDNKELQEIDWRDYYNGNINSLSDYIIKTVGLDKYNKFLDKIGNSTYSPQHQTILKKYTDFPKLFLKLFKDLQIRTVTDTKGNTWYEVDVPKGYLSREWLFKQGGKMNAIEQFKQGHKIHIKKKNRGKFTAYCGGNVTSACIARAKASGNPTLVKRATFAANARKWKHLEGGILLSNVDNRTDTTRKGSHEGLPAWGAADALNNAGLWDLLNYNLTGNPYIITGAPDILPGKIGTIKKSIQSVANINDKGLNVTKKLNTSVKNGLTYEDFDARHVNAGRNKYTKALRERALYMITNSYPNSTWYKLLQDILKKLAKKEAIGGDVKKFKKQRYNVLDNFINSGFFR